MRKYKGFTTHNQFFSTEMLGIVAYIKINSSQPKINLCCTQFCNQTIYYCSNRFSSNPMHLNGRWRLHESLTNVH
jgi:hypothetical protein